MLRFWPWGAALLALALSAGASAAPFIYLVDYPPSDGTVREFDGSLGVIDLATKQPVSAPVPIPQRPQAVAVTRRLDRLYTLHYRGYGPGFLAMLGAPDGRVLATLDVAVYPTALVLSPDERRAFVVGDRGLTIVDLVGWRALAELPIAASSLAIAPDGRQLFHGGRHGVGVLDVATLANRAVYHGPVSAVVLSRDGTRLFLVVPDDWIATGPMMQAIPQQGRKLVVVDSTTLAPVTETSIPQGSYSALLSNDGRRLYMVTGSAPVTITVVDTTSMTQQRIPTAIPNMHARRLALNADGLLALNEDERHLFVGDVDRVNVVDLATGAVTDVLRSFAPAMSAPVRAVSDPGTRSATVVEFRHEGLDHYFVTSDPREIDALDAGVLPGWKRTGEHFAAYAPGHPGDHAFPVCRFYGLPSAKLDSHFYSVNAGECARVGSAFAAGWQEETKNAFEAVMPDLITGACPPATLPVFRLWNARVDSNHRYAANFATRDAMLARGHVPEGYGPLGVAMCAPAGPQPGIP